MAKKKETPAPATTKATKKAPATPAPAPAASKKPAAATTAAPEASKPKTTSKSKAVTTDQELLTAVGALLNASTEYCTTEDIVTVESGPYDALQALYAKRTGATLGITRAEAEQESGEEEEEVDEEEVEEEVDEKEEEEEEDEEEEFDN